MGKEISEFRMDLIKSKFGNNRVYEKPILFHGRYELPSKLKKEAET